MRSAAAGAALVPAELPGVPVHGGAGGAAPEIPPDSAALLSAIGLMNARLRREPRAEPEIRAAQDRVIEALECLAAADARKGLAR